MASFIPSQACNVGFWHIADNRGVSRSQFDYLQTGLLIPIQNGYHALAIDEHRNDFAPTLWDVHHPKDPNAVIPPPRPLSNIEQRWFVGAHANVGGGYQADLLAQAPLRWMMQKAESHGLSFRSEVALDGDALKALIIDSYHSFGEGLYALVSPLLYRTIGQEPDVRQDGSHINVNETIDAACSSGGALIQRIARPTLSSGHNARRLILPSCKLPCGLMILA